MTAEQLAFILDKPLEEIERALQSLYNKGLLNEVEVELEETERSLQRLYNKFNDEKEHKH